MLTTFQEPSVVNLDRFYSTFMFYDSCMLIHTISEYILGSIRLFLILNDHKSTDQLSGKLLDVGLVTMLLRCSESYQPCLNAST
jgi:hypothetical protein